MSRAARFAVVLGVVLLVADAQLGMPAHVGAPAHASGSVGPGLGPMGGRGAYTLGKRLLFRELVCRRGCPIPRRGFDRDRARELKSSLDAAFRDDKPGTPDDEYVRVLFSNSPEESAANVAAVRTYLARRFRL